jgi:hypothetical protein
LSPAEAVAWHCISTGHAVAMIRILHVDMPGDALRGRI